MEGKGLLGKTVTFLTQYIFKNTQFTKLPELIAVAQSLGLPVDSAFNH